MARLIFPKLDWRLWLLLVAIGGWLSGFWWCRGRWEQGQWFLWVVLPVFALHADHVWNLWRDWYRERDWVWLGVFALIEWQFWITGIRTGDWWGGAGSGRDLVMMTVLLSLLAMAARRPDLSRWLREGTLALASVAVLVSLLVFYRDYGLSEQRFRLNWRYREGFNAVTTGVLVGYALVLGLRRERRHWLSALALALLGFALAGTESRGALLAVVAAVAVALAQAFFRREGPGLKGPLLLSCAAGGIGFVGYWAGASLLTQDTGGMVARGSAGRLEIYQHYLAHLSATDWLLGQGQVTPLGPEFLGWTVHHTHSAYLGQLVAFGAVGLCGLLALLVTVTWRVRASSELPLIVFGAVACLFDGGIVFSALSMARWEVLVLAVPLVMAWSRDREPPSVPRH